MYAAAAAAKPLQSCPTPCDPLDGSPPGSPIPGILQARILEWVAISFPNAWKWSRSVVSDSLQPHGLQPTRLLRPWDFPGKSTGVGCHCLLGSICIAYWKINLAFYTQSVFVLRLCSFGKELCLQDSSSTFSGGTQTTYAVLECRVSSIMAETFLKQKFLPEE